MQKSLPLPGGFLYLGMPRPFLILIAALLLTAQTHAQPTIRNVGDIPFDPALDDTSFHLADSNRVFQYYNTCSWWLEHKSNYRDAFQKAACKLSPAQTPNQSGRHLSIRHLPSVRSDLPGLSRLVPV